MNETIKIIDRQLADLEREKQGCDLRVFSLTAKIDVLRLLREAILEKERQEHGNQQVAVSSPVQANGVSQLTVPTITVKPTEAIKTYVREHPGVGRRAIINDVSILNLDSKSGNRRRLVDSLLRQLESGNQVSVRDDGYFLAEEKTGG